VSLKHVNSVLVSCEPDPMSWLALCLDTHVLEDICLREIVSTPTLTFSRVTARLTAGHTQVNIWNLWHTFLAGWRMPFITQSAVSRH